ncbi:MAG: hypothetical protein NT062_02280 [Proteobacteria bacterium]|nr:hypothetical protein [Pseudomonadota bacterium]
MRASILLVTLVTSGCGGTSTYHPPTAGDQGEHNAAELAGDDDFKPTYGAAELDRALIAERGAEATAERVIHDLVAREQDVATSDPLRIAIGDLAVRRRFIAALEACRASGRVCPPRLDEPAVNFDFDRDTEVVPLDAPLRFDLASWQAITTELHGRACACRTLLCVDAVGVAIDQLESRPMPEVQGDEVASLALTRARTCLFRLRGKSSTK